MKLLGPGNEEKLEFRGKAYRDLRVNQEFDKLSKLLEIVRNLSFKYPGINLEAEKAEIKKQEDWLEKYRAELIEQYDMVADYDKTYKEFIKLLKPSYSIDADNIASVFIDGSFWEALGLYRWGSDCRFCRLPPRRCDCN